MTMGEVAPVAVLPPGDAVTVYPVTGEFVTGGGTKATDA